MKNKLSITTDLVKRLKSIEGHLKKIREMVEEKRYCIDILQQTAAVKMALKKAEDLILKNHLQTCFIKAFRKNQSQKALREILEIFQKSK